MLLNEALDDVCKCTYPATVEEIKENCGENTIELKNGDTITMNEIFESIQDHPNEFRDDVDLRNYVLSIIPNGGIGRKKYDDRGANINQTNIDSL